MRLIAEQVMGTSDFSEKTFVEQVEEILVLGDWQFEFHFYKIYIFHNKFILPNERNVFTCLVKKKKIYIYT